MGGWLVIPFVCFTGNGFNGTNLDREGLTMVNGMMRRKVGFIKGVPKYTKVKEQEQGTLMRLQIGNKGQISQGVTLLSLALSILFLVNHCPKQSGRQPHLTMMVFK